MNHTHNDELLPVLRLCFLNSRQAPCHHEAWAYFSLHTGPQLGGAERTPLGTGWQLRLKFAYLT
jgi:hypothetical protein